ncbi:MAG: hypothetical protein GF320_06175, partial [Armatimonadia bacterium]|nr:hypothetical protein [Armatimonadia bacterium]
MRPPRESASPVPSGPLRTRQRAWRVRGAGRATSIPGQPYQDTYWFEGHRPSLSWPIALWCFDGAGAVGSPIDGTVQARATTAAAIDALRRSLALQIPEGVARAQRGISDAFDLPAALASAMREALEYAANRAVASRDPTTPSATGLVVAGVRSNRIVAIRSGAGDAVLLRESRAIPLFDAHAESELEGSGLRRTETDGVGEGHFETVTVDAAAGDVVLVVSEGLASSAAIAETLCQVLAASATLDDLCERAMLELAPPETEDREASVALGVGLEEGGSLGWEDQPDPLPYALAMRTTREREAPLGSVMTRMKALLGGALGMLPSTEDSDPDYEGWQGDEPPKRGFFSRLLGRPESEDPVALGPAWLTEAESTESPRGPAEFDVDDGGLVVSEAPRAAAEFDVAEDPLIVEEEPLEPEA